MAQRRRPRSRKSVRNSRRTTISLPVMVIIVLAAITLIGGVFVFLVSRSRRGEEEVASVIHSAETAEEDQNQTQLILPPDNIAAEGLTDSGSMDDSGADATWEVKQVRIADTAQEMLEEMTLEEKVAQLFFVTPEEITGYNEVTICGDVMRAALNLYPVGGLIFLDKNLQEPKQTNDMLTGIQEYMQEQTGRTIFLGIDEEGGRVLRIGDNEAFDVETVEAMYDVAKGGAEAVEEAADTIGTYLSDLGFNVDFAPVADIWTNPDNEVIGDRSFSDDPEEVTELARVFADTLTEHGILACYKHFPGHGDTYEDSHEELAYSRKTLRELKEAELIPFEDGAAHHVPFIMVSHVSLPEVTGDDIPASLSEEIVTDLLRDEMGYDGIIITDSLNMGAVSNHYTAGEAAVQAIAAGCDMLLMSGDFRTSYGAVLAAVYNDRLTEERIDASVLRILELKLQME